MFHPIWSPQILRLQIQVEHVELARQPAPARGLWKKVSVVNRARVRTVFWTFFVVAAFGTMHTFDSFENRSLFLSVFCVLARNRCPTHISLYSNRMSGKHCISLSSSLYESTSYIVDHRWLQKLAVSMLSSWLSSCRAKVGEVPWSSMTQSLVGKGSLCSRFCLEKDRRYRSESTSEEVTRCDKILA